LLDRLVDAANEPALSTGSSEPAADALPGLVRHPWRRLAKGATRLGDHPSDERLHQLRIRTKRARYAAEAAAPVLGKPARAFAQAAAGLQEVLGDLNDAVVAAAWLESWSQEAGDREAAQAAATLAAAEHGAAERLRGQWRAAWEELADPKLSAWM
jgi:CHAD domain-containing protein